MPKESIIYARVSAQLKQQIAEEAALRGEKDAVVVREALREYFARRSTRSDELRETPAPYGNLTLPFTLPAWARDCEDSLLITDDHGDILWYNTRFQRLCGYTLEESQGRRPGNFLQGKETDAAVVAQLHDAIANHEPVNVAITNYHQSGRSYPVFISLAPFSTAQGRYFAAAEREIRAGDDTAPTQQGLTKLLQRFIAVLSTGKKTHKPK